MCPMKSRSGFSPSCTAAAAPTSCPQSLKADNNHDISLHSPHLSPCSQAHFISALRLISHQTHTALPAPQRRRNIFRNRAGGGTRGGSYLLCCVGHHSNASFSVLDGQIR